MYQAWLQEPNFIQRVPFEKIVADTFGCTAVEAQAIITMFLSNR